MNKSEINSNNFKIVSEAVNTIDAPFIGANSMLDVEEKIIQGNHRTYGELGVLERGFTLGTLKTPGTVKVKSGSIVITIEQL
jgi:hypothetical protein